MIDYNLHGTLCSHNATRMHMNRLIQYVKTNPIPTDVFLGQNQRAQKTRAQRAQDLSSIIFMNPAWHSTP